MSVPAQGLSIRAEVLQRLTLGDLEDFEELSGMPFGAVLNGSALTAKAIRAFLFVLERSDNSKLRFESFRALTLEDVVEKMGKYQATEQEETSDPSPDRVTGEAPVTLPEQAIDPSEPL